MKNYKVNILYSDTGGGHRSAANAIIEAANRLMLAKFPGSINNIRFAADNVVEKSHPANKALVDFYNFLLRYHQSWMIYYFNFINAFRIDNNEFIYKFTKKYIHEKLLELNSDILVSVHPMLNNYVVRGLEELGLRDKTKFFVVVTDPNDGLWKGWAACKADLVYVPNELASNKLIEYGVSPEKIKIVGMPVHPKFLDQCTITKSDTKMSLGLNPRLYTVCINAGWAGGGNMLSILREILKTSLKIQVVFICGNNKALYNEACKISKNSKILAKILPYCENMPNIMDITDLMITKGGGLTVYEALAKNLDLVFDTISQPMPQEAGTIKHLCEEKRAYGLSEPSQVGKIIAKCQDRHGRNAKNYKNNKYDCFGSYIIAENIINALHKDLVLMKSQELIEEESFMVS